MSHLSVFGARLRTAAALGCVVLAAACGGGGEVGVVVVDDGPEPLALLDIELTRVGPRAIAVDWSDDPFAARFTVSRDGFALATVDALTLIDASVFVNVRYCYQVSGYATSGQLISLSDTACVVLLP